MFDKLANNKYFNWFCAISVFALFIISLYFNIKQIGLYVPTFHIDGAFQTASGLFRLEQGYSIGKDFYPYLGIIPVIINYPLFKLFGSTLVASVMSAKFMVYLITWLEILILLRIVFKAKLANLILFASAIWYLLYAIFYNYNFEYFKFTFQLAFDPGFSLKPIRAFAPYFFLLCFIGIEAKYSSSKFIYNSLISILLGGILLWSNDFAIPTFITSILLLQLLFYIKGNKFDIKNTLIISLCAVLVYFLLLTIITNGNPIALLKYNFIDIATDQFWYFAPYDEKYNIFSLFDIYKLLLAIPKFSLIIFLCFIFITLKKKNQQYFYFTFIGTTLFLGGTLASLGGHVETTYYAAFSQFIHLCIALILIEKLAVGSLNKNILLICSYLISILGISYALYINVEKYNKPISTTTKLYSNQLGGYIGTDWEDYLSFVAKNKNKVVIEEYFGIWSAFHKSFSPWSVDSVIHALGQQRKLAKNEINKADFIVTTKKSFSPYWQPWNLVQNYWLYEELLKHWEPIQHSPATIVWQKITQPRNFITVKCEISDDKKSFILDSNEIGLYSINLGYQSTGSKRQLLLMETNISSAPGTTISLQPLTSASTFPVFINATNGNQFDMAMLGSSNNQFNITSCKAEKITFTNHQFFNPSLNFYLTYQIWPDVIAKDWAGFILPNTKKYVNNFQVGKYILFPNYEIKQIINTEKSGELLNVIIEGDILDPEKFRYSDLFQLFNSEQDAVAAIPESFYLTDNNWNKGVSTKTAAFILPNNAYYRNLYQVGKYVKFNEQTKRKIISTTENGRFLNIYVEGKPLNANEVGLPNTYKIISN